MIKIFLDDERSPPSDEWVVVKTAHAAIALLSEHEGHVEALSLDHDLGDGNGSGYDVACWVEERHHFGFPTPTTIKIHSQNAVGIQNMRRALAKIPGFVR